MDTTYLANCRACCLLVIKGFVFGSVGRLRKYGARGGCSWIQAVFVLLLG